MISVSCEECGKKLGSIGFDSILDTGEDPVILSDGSLYLERRCESCSLTKEEFWKKVREYGSKK